MKIESLLAILSIGLLMACNNDDDEEIICKPDTPSAQSYFISSAGSYWVYDTYEVQSTGAETLHRQNDTLFALGDTLIDGVAHQKFFGKRNPIQPWRTHLYYRDSLGYIINHATGQIEMSYTNFDNALYFDELPAIDPVFMSLKMEQTLGNVMVPAGIFASVINAKRTLLSTGAGVIGITNNYYAPQIGRLTRTNFYVGQYLSEQTYFEERLVAYFIAP